MTTANAGTIDVELDEIEKNKYYKLTPQEIQNLLLKYDESKQERKKYTTYLLWVILLIIFLCVILGIFVLGSYLTKEIETDTISIHAPENDYVLLKEKGSDKYIRSSIGFLQAPLQYVNLTGYSKVLGNGQVIPFHDQPEFIMNASRDHAANSSDPYSSDIYVSLQHQIYSGKIGYNILEQSCNLLFQGYSQFTVRFFDMNDDSVPKSVATLKVLTERCEDIQQGLPSTATFTINELNHFVECVDNKANNELCDIYQLKQYQIPLSNFTNSSFTQNRRRSRRRLIGQCPDSFQFNGQTCNIDQGATNLENSHQGLNLEGLIRAGLVVSFGPKAWIAKGISAVGALVEAFSNSAETCEYAQPDPCDSNCVNAPYMDVPIYQCCPTPSPSPCFPDDSIVTTPNGAKLIQDVEIGDKLLSVNSYYGVTVLEYSDVYMHGHRMNDVKAQFITLHSINYNVSGSKDHFVYVCQSKDCDWSSNTMKRFGDVIKNEDYIFDIDLNHHLVINITLDRMTGLYNPYTMNGNIVVNGIVASCHSEWIFDSLIPKYYESFLPYLYQILFSPIRWLYVSVPDFVMQFDKLHPNGWYDVVYISWLDFGSQLFNSFHT